MNVAGMSPEEIVILNYIDIVNEVSDPAALSVCGVEVERANEILDSLVKRGYLIKSDEGLYITEDGEKAVNLYRNNVKQEHKEAVSNSYKQFCKLNDVFKEVVTDWQMKRTKDGEYVANDHSDQEYDEKVLKRLYDVDIEMEKVFSELIKTVPRYEIYLNRFKAALKNIKEGKTEYLASYKVDSYHTIWFELHEDLIRLLGEKREE